MRANISNMENYIVSARKYRPVTFESVVGQESITQTLRNAIRTNHLAQAYLFCGPRGVGKTTCARIFAKTINCLNPTEGHDACNECESCRAFNEQRSFNIHELDAASNNSVENIRTLIDQVRIPPQIGKYSVYIIDEVHMLSKDAFNALLKTLEEPPSYAIFILATTEKHKVIPTILSRCQIYDFSRITIADMIHHLQYVAKQEGINVSEEALNVVAQKADGGMRDALSIFDQLVSFCGNDITYEQAIEVLNVLDSEYYFRTVDCALSGDVSQMLLLFNNVLSKGFDAQNFIIGLGSHLRDLLVSKDAVTVRLLETSDSIRQHYAEQAKQCSAQFLFHALSLVNECDIQYRVAKNKRLTVEIMLIRLSQLSASDETPSVSQSQPLKSISAQPAAQPASQPPTQTNEQPRPATPSPAAKPQPTVAPSQPAAAPQRVNIAPRASQPAAQPSGRPVRVSIVTDAPASTDSNLSGGESVLSDKQQSLRNNPFTINDLEEAWLLVPKSVGGDARQHATLLNTAIQCSGNVVTICYSNESQEKDMLGLIPVIRQVLADKLQNDNIVIETKVVENLQKELRSNVDRYSYLITKNTLLGNLSQKLDLSLE